jgi:hypothetical protein
MVVVMWMGRLSLKRLRGGPWGAHILRLLREKRSIPGFPFEPGGY